MTLINIYEAKTNLSKLLERVALGEEIIIAKAGKPIARLAPLVDKPVTLRVPGLLKGKITYSPDWEETPQDVIDSFNNSHILGEETWKVPTFNPTKVAEPLAEFDPK